MLVESVDVLALAIRWVGKTNWTTGLIRISQIQDHACRVGCAGSEIGSSGVNRSGAGGRVWLCFVDLGKPCARTISGTRNWKELDFLPMVNLSCYEMLLQYTFLPTTAPSSEAYPILAIPLSQVCQSSLVLRSLGIRESLPSA